MNKKAIFIFFVSVVFVVGAVCVCVFWLFKEKISTEAALEKDSQYVVTIDHSEFFEGFPDYGIGDRIGDVIFDGETLQEMGLDYEEDILPVLKGKWRLSMSGDLSGDLSGGGSVYAVYTEEESKMKNIFEKAKPENLFYGNDGELFVFASTQAEVESALKRFKEGTGFSMNENSSNFSKNSNGNLGYFYFKFVAEEDGFGFDGFANLSDDETVVAESLPYFGKKLSLLNKIPLENPFLYLEMQNIGRYVESFVTEFSGISAEEVRGIFGSQFAFAVGDSGEKYPTISFYLDVDEQYSSAAKKLGSVADAYIDTVIKEFDEMVGVTGAFKKDVNVVNGGGLNKLYVDFSAVPDEMLAGFQMIPGVDIKKMKIEIYYGLTGDNVFTFALYPEFNKVYGENIVGKDKEISEVFEDGEDLFYAFFFSPGKFINFVDTNYYKAAKDSGILTGDYEKNYVMLKDAMQVLKHFVASFSMPEKNKILFDAFLKFQDVENSALEKVREGR
ncbi:MAG: hypothetical protein WC651_00230 [Candidatus Gracilibacteria bacterium]|jgi:hypothetical protein